MQRSAVTVSRAVRTSTSSMAARAMSSNAVNPYEGRPRIPASPMTKFKQSMYQGFSIHMGKYVRLKHGYR